jgi:translation initiation factor 3 subunit C
LQDPDAFEKEYLAAVLPVEAPVSKPKKQKRTEDDDADFVPVGGADKGLDISTESLFKNLQAVQEARGKKVGIHGIQIFGGM